MARMMVGISGDIVTKKARAYRIRKIGGENGLGITVPGAFLADADLGVGDKVYLYMSTSECMVVVPERLKEQFEARHVKGFEQIGEKVSPGLKK